MTVRVKDEPVEVRRSDRGFTLVELLIVISILGILATVTVFSVRGISNRGHENACASERAMLVTAAETYFALNPGVTQIPPTGTGGDRYEQTLVDANLLRAVSTKQVVNADGSVMELLTGCRPVTSVSVVAPVLPGGDLPLPIP